MSKGIPNKAKKFWKHGKHKGVQQIVLRLARERDGHSKPEFKKSVRELLKEA